MGTIAHINQALTIAPAGGFAPTDIAGCWMWFDASNAGSITASSGAVSQWSDLSGNARHVTQGTGSLQPVTGSRTINSLNAISFNDASEDDLSRAGATPSVSTVIGVIQYDITGATSMWYGYNSIAVYQNGGAYSMYSGGAISGGTVDTSAHIWIAVFDTAANGGGIYIDSPSAAVATGDKNGGNSATTLGRQGGGGNTFDGLMGEVIVYDSALSQADRTLVYDYLSAKWGTP
jgi:hypothetical protein